MTPELLVAVLSLVGTLFGSICGIIVSNRLVQYRIEQLEKKMDKHNSLIERMTAVERDLKSAFRLLDDLQRRDAS